MHARAPRWTSIALAAALAVGAVGCSSSDGGTSDGGRSTTTRPSTTTTTAPKGPQAYDGPAEGFYAAPDPIPAAAHGTLLRYQRLADLTPNGATAYRILYTSRSVQGDPIVVSGTATVPTAAAPAGGRPIITIAHGTTGIADECAPSKDPGGSEIALVAGKVAADYLVAQTDYEGLGTPGRHPYLVGESEGRSTVDAALAVAQLPDAHAGKRVGIVGYSQGGHGALWAAQVLPAWAPDLDLVGTFSGAPASEIDIVLAAAPYLPVAGFAYMTVAGIAAAYPDADPATFLTPKGLSRLDTVDEGCGGDIIRSFAGTPASELVRQDGPASKPWKELAAANDAGTEKTSDAPTLVIHSKEDRTVPIAFSERLLERMCEEGQVVERRVLPTGDHGPAAVPAYQQGLAWLTARFADDPPAPVSSCPTP